LPNIANIITCQTLGEMSTPVPRTEEMSNFGNKMGNYHDDKNNNAFSFKLL
jgi:hypothetical protein